MCPPLKKVGMVSLVFDVGDPITFEIVPLLIRVELKIPRLSVSHCLSVSHRLSVNPHPGQPNLPFPVGAMLNQRTLLKLLWMTKVVHGNFAQSVSAEKQGRPVSVIYPTMIPSTSTPLPPLKEILPLYLPPLIMVMLVMLIP
jgi:hypothetical protein